MDRDSHSSRTLLDVDGDGDVGVVTSAAAAWLRRCSFSRLVITTESGIACVERKKHRKEAILFAFFFFLSFFLSVFVSLPSLPSGRLYGAKCV